tara:strand:- start:3008 stop:3574 length:567 start_codon:yes stop_codon:yes gene_type:complete
MAQVGWFVAPYASVTGSSALADTADQFFENIGDNVDFGNFNSPRTLYIIPWSTPGFGFNFYVLSAANFTISGGTPGSSSVIEFPGDSTLDGVSNTFTQGDVGVTLPNEIYSVTIEDTESPNTSGNVLKATINFKSEFTVTGNHTINIDFDGFATLGGLTEAVDVTIVDDSGDSENTNGTVEISDPNED